ncbi:MAG: DUF924 family protein [Rhodospirillaceae bacterium]
MERWREIYDFWFGPPDGPDHGEVREFWFRGGPEVDREIRERFEADHARAAAGGYDDWRDGLHSSLALVVLLDQFPRNMYRGEVRSFAADPVALSVARHIVAQPWHDRLLPVQRLFAYLPFEHSEDMADQRRAVELFTAMEDHPGRGQWVDYAVQHLVIIEKFGRFPHRNAILGRTCTEAEERWLEDTEERFGTAAEDRAAEDRAAEAPEGTAGTP